MRGSVLFATALLAAGAAIAAAPHHTNSTVPPPLAGDSGSPNQHLAVTVYNNNLALVQDIRHIDVPAGRTRLEFKGVSASIRPETVALSSRGLTVVEQNFDYDLLTPAKMMEKAVGHQIQIIRTNPATGAQAPETATVLSVNDGVVLRVGNRIEVLRDDGIPTRVVFSSIPENLRPEPTLSVTVDAAGGGARDVTLSYLTTGLGWKADYVALFDEKQATVGVNGWITLTNNSGTSFRDAKTQLIAGDINLTNSSYDYYQRQQGANRSGGTGTSSQTAIADYDIFALPERVTIAQNQTKQVAFLDLHAKAEKAYEFRGEGFDSSDQPIHAEVVLKFSNTNRPLPTGVVRVYMRDTDGDPKFVGEDAIDQTPAGSDLGIKIGEAFDVTVQPTVVTNDRIDRFQTRYAMAYRVHNALSHPVTVDIRQGGIWRNGKVEVESIPSKRVDAHTLAWSVPVPANGETVLTFTVDTGY